MKRAKNIGQLKAQCSAIMAAAINGELDLKKARTALSAAHAIARLHEADTSYVVAMLHNGQVSPKLNHAPLHDDDDAQEVIAIARPDEHPEG